MLILDEVKDFWPGCLILDGFKYLRLSCGFWLGQIFEANFANWSWGQIFQARSTYGRGQSWLVGSGWCWCSLIIISLLPSRHANTPPHAIHNLDIHYVKNVVTVVLKFNAVFRTESKPMHLLTLLQPGYFSISKNQGEKRPPPL